MENTIYVALSRQMALRSKMDVVANNIANMSTPGYRSQNMVFTQYLEKTPASPKADTREQLSMVLDYGQYQNTEAGPLQRTGNALDVAVQGPGYFGVQTPQGIMYTRAGNFQLNATGELVTGTGQIVAGTGGGAITIPKGARDVVISEDGTISSAQGQLGKLMVTEFENVQSLEAMGNGLYNAPDGGRPAENSRVMQGMIEDSNVSPVLEMTRMLDTLRAYQNTQKILDNENDRQRTMIRQLTKTG